MSTILSPFHEFEERLPPALRSTWQNLDSPARIQEYLDSLAYVSEELDRSPLRVMIDGQCHCLDGGIFAAAALQRIGYPPLILDLTPAPGLDDDHVLALFRRRGRWGALAKSNFAGLRYREPVYRSLRELAMSYFEDYYNLDGVKTLRGYTRPLNLSRFHRYHWLWDEGGVKKISTRLYSLRSTALLSAESAAELLPVDRRSYEAGMLGTSYADLFKPGEH